MFKKMNHMRKQSIISFLGAFALLLATSCEKEYLNPSAASESQVVESVDGLIALTNGLQYRYSIGRQSPVYTTITASGFTTGELAILNAGNADENFLSLGGNQVVGNNGVVTNLWEQCHLLKANADIVLNNANKFGDPAFQSGVIGFASIFKALSLGTLAQFFEQAPIAVGQNATFSSRQQVLEKAVEILQSAKNAVEANAPSTTFTSKTPTGVDIKNTLYALIARYSAMLGKWDDVLAAANKVDLSKKSFLVFDDLTRNPIFDVALSNVNVFQPINANLGLPTDLAPSADDQRVLFFLTSKTPGANNIFRGKGYFSSNAAAIPVYTPGEMMLLKAEAYARKSQLAEAKTELDKVLTKTAATDIYGLGAGLPAYSGPQTQADLLKEIYRNRAIELYMSGMKLEDSRRFNRPGPGQAGAERNRNFYPYPNNERDNNPSTPADPAG